MTAARWRDVEVFLRRLAARSAVVESGRWKVVAGLVERRGRAAAAPPGGIPGGEVHDGAGDACVERRAGVGRGRGGGDRERRVEEQRRHLGVLVLPHRQRVDHARDDDVAPLPRDVRSGGGISENTRERTRVPGARRVQSLALGRERALSVRGRRPGLGVREEVLLGGAVCAAAFGTVRRGYRLRRASHADRTHPRGAVDAQVPVAALRVKAVVHGECARV